MASGAEDPAWHAAAEAERQRLRAEAEQRFAERLRQDGAEPVPAGVSASPAPAQPEYPWVAEPDTTSNPPPQEVGTAVEPAAPVASEPQAVPSPAPQELEPVADAPFAVQPHSGPASLAPASEQPAEAATEIPADDSLVNFQAPGTAEAAPSPPRPAGAGTGLEPLPDPTRDTPLAAPQSAADPAAPGPEDYNPDMQAPEPLIAAPPPRADDPHEMDVRDVEAAVPALQPAEPDERDATSAEPDERDAASAEPALF
jgi:DNA polymerase-3 subunit gamma/tau